MTLEVALKAFVHRFIHCGFRSSPISALADNDTASHLRQTSFIEMATRVEQLDCFPRVGWVEGPTPVVALDGLAAELGLGWLGVKRDDAIGKFGGSSKVRKLDYLLASPRFERAPAWVSVGAIGSGHLACLAQAATELDKRLRVHVFNEPLSDGVVDNLAAIAGGSAEMRHHRSRTTMVLRNPALFLGRGTADCPVIPAGGTQRVGTLGTVRAGLELAEQVRAGLLPEPSRIVLSWGTGGTVVGLSVGLALGGLRTRVDAVAVVERILSTRSMLASQQRAVIALLESAGVEGARGLQPAEVTMLRGQLGRGYGHPTAAALAAVERAQVAGLKLEPVYTGKALALLLEQAPPGAKLVPGEELSAGAERPENEAVLFWNTNRGALPMPDPAWRERLPVSLAGRIPS
jgi:D-cysteine desulfhydrase